MSNVYTQFVSRYHPTQPATVVFNQDMFVPLHGNVCTLLKTSHYSCNIRMLPVPSVLLTLWTNRIYNVLLLFPSLPSSSSSSTSSFFINNYRYHHFHLLIETSKESNRYRECRNHFRYLVINVPSFCYVTSPPSKKIILDHVVYILPLHNIACCVVENQSHSVSTKVFLL